MVLLRLSHSSTSVLNARQSAEGESGPYQPSENISTVFITDVHNRSLMEDDQQRFSFGVMLASLLSMMETPRSVL